MKYTKLLVIMMIMLLVSAGFAFVGETAQYGNSGWPGNIFPNQIKGHRGGPELITLHGYTGDLIHQGALPGPTGNPGLPKAPKGPVQPPYRPNGENNHDYAM